MGQDNLILELNEDAGDRLRDTITPYARGVNPMVSVQMTNSGSVYAQQPQQRLPYQLKSFRPPIMKRELLEPLSRQHRKYTNVDLLPSYRTFERHDRPTPVTWRQPKAVSAVLARRARPRAGDETRTQAPKLQPFERTGAEPKFVARKTRSEQVGADAATRTRSALVVAGKEAPPPAARRDRERPEAVARRNLPASGAVAANTSHHYRPQPQPQQVSVQDRIAVSYPGLQTRLPAVRREVPAAPLAGRTVLPASAAAPLTRVGTSRPDFGYRIAGPERVSVPADSGVRFAPRVAADAPQARVRDRPPIGGFDNR